MEKKFGATSEPLAELLKAAAEGELQLPDFQRGWVWDDARIRSLLASISLSYPIGAVMTLSTGNPDVRFRCRPLEGVKARESVQAAKLLLDGQQRLTSLYCALMSREPVVTRDSRGKKVRRHYYVDIDAAIDSDVDREEVAIVSVPEDRIERTDFGRRVVRDLSSRKNEVELGMFPLDCLFDSKALKEWRRLYEASEGTPPGSRWEKWGKFEDVVVYPFLHYQVAEIELAKSTTRDAVCRVFEKVNTGGVTLTVFELLTATFAADEFSLRDDWSKRQRAFRERKTYEAMLQGLPASQFLQVVTLLATLARREERLREEPLDERPPAVACQRRDILNLDLKDYEAWADRAVDGFRRAVEFLHGEHIFRSQDLPYATQLVPLAAVLARLDMEPLPDKVTRRLRKWFWCGVFGEMYGAGVETRSAIDLQDCVAWISGDGEEPRTVHEAQFQADRLLSLRTRRSAAYKGVYALQMKSGARDFRLDRRIDDHAFFDHAVDIHHVFPRRLCNRIGVDKQRRDSIVNKTPLAAKTNRSLGARPPSRYLAGIEGRDGIAADRLDSIVRTHHVHPPALRGDDFDEFFDRRFEALLVLIEKEMGKSVNRGDEQTETDAGEAIRKLVETGESRTVEFKATGRTNSFTGKTDVAIEWMVLRSIAGFMNADGGTLLVGVGDDGGAVGIERDFAEVKNRDRDGWELWLNGLVYETLGSVAATAMRVTFCEAEPGKTIARIDVEPSGKAVYVKPSRRFLGPAADGQSRIKDLKHGRNIFFVRRGNATQVLSGPDLDEYRHMRWERH